MPSTLSIALSWAKEFDHSVHQLFPAVFQADKFCRVFARNADQDGRPRRLDHMSFGPGPYPGGALWQVALISLDRKLQAFAKAIPHLPLLAMGPAKSHSNSFPTAVTNFWPLALDLFQEIISSRNLDTPGGLSKNG